MTRTELVEFAQSLAELPQGDLTFALGVADYIRNGTITKVNPADRKHGKFASTPRKGKGGRPKGSKNKPKVPAPPTVEMTLSPASTIELPPVPEGYGVSN